VSPNFVEPDENITDEETYAILNSVAVKVPLISKEPVIFKLFVVDQYDPVCANIESPELPDEPLDPPLPDDPEVPELPEVPEEPDDPELPDDPLDPEVPDEPEVPEEPELPEVPEEPLQGPTTFKT
jgi:hypothetical protein